MPGWNAQPVPTSARDTRLCALIQQIFQENRGVYGSSRIYAALAAQGIHYSRKRVVRLTQQFGLLALPKRSRRPRAATCDTSGLIAPNVLDRLFSAMAKNTVWVTNATLIATREGWVALCMVLDLFSRRVVGWTMGTSENEELVTLADAHGAGASSSGECLF